MKKYLKILIPVFILLLGGMITMRIVQKSSQKKVEIHDIPAFEFCTMDSTLYKVSSLPSGKKTLLIHFNSTCEHCQYEAQELVKNAERLQSHNILLISDERIAIIQKFYEKYNLAKIPHLQILKSNGIDFKQYFGTSSVPAIFIYSAENKLLKHYKGEAKIEAILKYLD